MSEANLKLKKLGELVEILNNKRIPLSSKERANLSKIYPYYGAQGIVDFVDSYIFDGKNILIAEDGENLKSNNKSICTLATGKYWVNNHAHIVRANNENDTDYLFYKLNSISFLPYITGSAQPKLNKENLLNIPLYIHEKAEQKNISRVLSELDQKITLNNQINEELEAMAKTLYDYWFVQFDFPDENGKPYKSSGGKMVYNDQLKREIPEGWGVERLGELCEFRNGINYEKSETGDTLSKIVNVRNISNSITFVTTHDLDSIALDRKRIESYLVTERTILIARSGIPGSTRIVSDIPPNTIYSGFIIGATVTNMDLFYYVFYHLKNIELLMSNQSAGTIMKNISQTTLSEICIAIPNEEIQKKFSNRVSSLLDVIENNLKQNQDLTQLRDWLLPMLMNGQVRVEE